MRTTLWCQYMTSMQCCCRLTFFAFIRADLAVNEKERRRFLKNCDKYSPTYYIVNLPHQRRNGIYIVFHFILLFLLLFHIIFFFAFDSRESWWCCWWWCTLHINDFSGPLQFSIWCWMICSLNVNFETSAQQTILRTLHTTHHRHHNIGHL